MKKLFLATGLFVFALAPLAVAGEPTQSYLRIEAYLDEAPQDVEVLDRVEVTHNGSSRTLLIVDRKAHQVVSARPFDHTNGMPISVVSANGETETLFETAAGSRVQGTVYQIGQSLFLQELNGIH